MDIIHLGIVILSAIFATGNAQKGIYCVDPHTGLYYPVNSTWPSSTFCGTYTCNAKLISKGNTTEELDSIPTLESTLQNEDTYRQNYETGISFEDLEDEPKEGSGETIQDENNDFSKTIENVLQASKELSEISGEIHDIAKHVRLYKAANDLLKSITKAENIDNLSKEDTEKLLEALTNSLIKNDNSFSKEDGLDTADTLNIYHNMNRKDSTTSPNVSEYSKNYINSIHEPFYDYDNISPYISYYPSYFYSSPLYQPPYLNDMNRPVNAHVLNENSADNDINASDLKENYQRPDIATSQYREKNNYQPFSDPNQKYSDQYIKYWTSRGYNFPGYNIPKTLMGNSRQPDYSNYNSQHEYNKKQNLLNGHTRSNGQNTEYSDKNSNLNFVNSHHHHHHGIEKTEKYHPERSTDENIQKHSYKSIEHAVNEIPYKYYPFNYEGSNHKVENSKSNIAYYYYDPMKNEYTMNVPRNYTDYETYYKDYMKKYPNAASPVSEESIMDLNEYYKKYYSNEQKKISQNNMNEGIDSRQNPTRVQEVSKNPEAKQQEVRFFSGNYLNPPPSPTNEYFKYSEAKKNPISEERNVTPSNKYKISNSHVHHNDKFKMADGSIQKKSNVQNIIKSGISDVKDFELRLSSKSVDSSEESLNQSKTDNDRLLGTDLVSKLFKPIRLLNLSPYTPFKSKRGPRRISKRSLNDSLSGKNSKNGRRKWKSYITVQGCVETLEPGFFRSGDATKHYPLCCPQKIPNK